MKKKPGAGKAFEAFLGLVRDHAEVEIMRSDNNGKFTSEAFKYDCRRHRITRELITASSP